MRCMENNRCMPITAICDGHVDCPDNSDESIDKCWPSTGHCLLSEFQCKVNKYACIPRRWVGDQQFDCGPGDYSDEFGENSEFLEVNSVPRHLVDHMLAGPVPMRARRRLRLGRVRV